MYNKKRNDEKFDPVEIFPDTKFSLHIANFDVKKSTIIIIHGYEGNKNSSVNRLLREGMIFKYLTANRYIIIVFFGYTFYRAFRFFQKWRFQSHYC